MTTARFDEPTHVAAVLAALANGDHPFTGMPLPAEHVLRDPRVKAALAAAAEQLDPEMHLEQLEWHDPTAAPRPPRQGQAWTDAETTNLIAGFDAERSSMELAAELGRTKGAVRSRLVYLGLIQVRTEKGDLRFLRNFEDANLLARVIDAGLVNRAERLLQAQDPVHAEERLRVALARYETSA